MFKTLSDSFQRILSGLRGYGKLTESNITDAMREVRTALLEADVNYKVAKEFTEKVKARCLGKAVLESITPGQQVVKEVHDEMVALLGGGAAAPDLSGRPAAVLLIGLQGVGKTTTAGKMAAMWGKAGKKTLLAACDLKRPAAVDQLRILAEKAGAGMMGPSGPDDDPVKLAVRAVEHARRSGADIVLLDTAGRLHVDEPLVAELAAIRNAVSVRNVLLVVDSAMGQESVNVAREFHEKVGLTGLVLSRLDGDSRGGAAFSIRSVTGCPVMFCGTGERLDDIEAFDPGRMASRILGMGDIVGLVEKARGKFDRAEAEKLQERMMAGHLDLDDFLAQVRQMRKMGPLENLLEMLPMGGNLRGSFDAAAAGEEFSGYAKKAEAIILSMTPQERRRPDIINGSRRRRIAAGSGTTVRDVNELLTRFDQARRMGRQFKKLRKRMVAKVPWM